LAPASSLYPVTRTIGRIGQRRRARASRSTARRVAPGSLAALRLLKGAGAVVASLVSRVRTLCRGLRQCRRPRSSGGLARRVEDDTGIGWRRLHPPPGGAVHLPMNAGTSEVQVDRVGLHRDKWKWCDVARLRTDLPFETLSGSVSCNRGHGWMQPPPGATQTDLRATGTSQRREGRRAGAAGTRSRAGKSGRRSSGTRRQSIGTRFLSSQTRQRAWRTRSQARQTRSRAKQSRSLSLLTRSLVMRSRPLAKETRPLRWTARSRAKRTRPRSKRSRSHSMLTRRLRERTRSEAKEGRRQVKQS
jgi:hypothetical protein